MDLSNLTKLAIPAAILYALYRFVPDQRVKAMVLGVAGTIAAGQIPYVKDVI
ncbi:hypothetical protein ACS5PN_03855 [Roseateles sp. NT4]|uniref:hypothetical protein n=1 Tax=Roseateles sp. NT4 TaxID=3453715 RepID=UPI003EEE9FFE